MCLRHSPYSSRWDKVLLALILLWFCAIALSQAVTSGITAHEFIFMAPARPGHTLMEGRESNGMLPNLFYSYIWSGSTPRSDCYQRLPSLACALISLGLTFILGQRLGKHLKKPHLGAYGTFLLAISASLLGFATHCRFYAGAITAALLSTLLLLAFAEKPSWGRLFLYQVSWIISLTSMVLNSLLFLPHMVFLAIASWRKTWLIRGLTLTSATVGLVGYALHIHDPHAQERLTYSFPSLSPLEAFYPFLHNGDFGSRHAYRIYSDCFLGSTPPLKMLVAVILLILGLATAKWLYTHIKSKCATSSRTDQSMPLKSSRAYQSATLESSHADLNTILDSSRADHSTQLDSSRADQNAPFESASLTNAATWLCPLTVILGFAQIFLFSHLICNVLNSCNCAMLWPFWSLMLATVCSGRGLRYLLFTVLALAAPYTHWHTLPDADSCKNYLYVLASFRRPTEPVFFSSGAFYTARYLPLLNLDERQLTRSAPLALQAEDLPALPSGAFVRAGRCEDVVEGWPLWTHRSSNTIWLVVDKKTGQQDEMFSIHDHIDRALPRLAQQGRLSYLERELTQDFSLYRVTFTDNAQQGNVSQ